MAGLCGQSVFKTSAAALARRCVPAFSAPTRHTGQSACFSTQHEAPHMTHEAEHEVEAHHVEQKAGPSPGSFDDLFASSSFVRTGSTRGRLLPAKIIDMNKTHLKLELGTKFHSFIPIPMRPGMLNIGDEVIVMMRTSDYTEHVAGDSRPISIFEGDVSFVRPGRRQTGRTMPY